MMDDNFFTVITAIKWGRNIQDNVRKFVQFQMTVNISCVFFVITTCLILGHSPFNVVQLLWINLIMDVLAAIAFSTENPPAQIRRDRVSSKDRIITKPMMRSILFQSLYQILVMLLLLYVGPQAGGYEYNLYTTELRQDGNPTYRLMHQTFMFQCFVMMNIFNMINCRVLDPIPMAPSVSIEEMSVEDHRILEEATKPSFNIFANPFRNFWFWIIVFGELNIQYLMVGYASIGIFFTTTPLTFSQHLTAVCLGLGSWAVAAILKLTGPKLINAMPQFSEDKEALDAAKNVSDRAQSLKFKKTTPQPVSERLHSEEDE